MKRLVICCDGTWQRLFGKLTNVALTARAVAPRDAGGRAQIVYYSAGVGASVDGLNLWQGATGADLDEHLLQAYLFLNLNYEPGDELFLFGFSRGAYTVRSLAGLLRKCGVLHRSHVDKARAALELYRDRHVSADHGEAQRFRAAHAIAWPRLGEAPFGGPLVDLRIKYMGVWDTVGALGIPRLLPISLGLNRRYEFHDTALSRAVEFARHAVAIDERRAAFTPTLWSNVGALNPPHRPQRIAQSWFPGDHGGVGGGGDAHGLSNCALMWVLEGAEEAGLALAREPGSVLSACLADIDPIRGALEAAKSSPLLNLLGAKWRGGPHRIEELHEAARLRWVANSNYRPKPLARLGGQIENAVLSARAA